MFTLGTSTILYHLLRYIDAFIVGAVHFDQSVYYVRTLAVIEWNKRSNCLLQGWLHVLKKTWSSVDS